jgi:cyanophycinase-like exopeptidase
MRFLFFLAIPLSGFTQNYTSYFTGNPVDLNVSPYGGVCLMGGATEDDNAMIWFLEQANGGDILVLRASGSDGYNDYFYTDLGVTVNSVETIVFNDATASDENYVHQKIEQAEAIWFAGGDQWNYISYWRNSPIDSLINLALEERNIVIGGTSAGMAILGDYYFTAENGTVTSTTALNNPYAANVTIDSAHFIDVPYMDNVITDTHYDNPDRRGRHFTFLAKMTSDFGEGVVMGIACEEYVAVCIDTLGIAHVYGGYPTYDEQAYFVRTYCGYLDTPWPPEVLAPSTPLTWDANQMAVLTYKVNGTSTGNNYFDLNTWQNGSGGEWQFWFANAGVFSTSVTSAPFCETSIDEFPITGNHIKLFPNPSELYFRIESDFIIQEFSISDLSGKKIIQEKTNSSELNIQTDTLNPGLYNLHYNIDGYWYSVRFSVK